MAEDHKGFEQYKNLIPRTYDDGTLDKETVAYLVKWMEEKHSSDHFHQLKDSARSNVVPFMQSYHSSKPIMEFICMMLAEWGVECQKQYGEGLHFSKFTRNNHPAKTNPLSWTEMCLILWTEDEKTYRIVPEGTFSVLEKHLSPANMWELNILRKAQAKAIEILNDRGY